MLRGRAAYWLFFDLHRPLRILSMIQGVLFTTVRTERLFLNFHTNRLLLEFQTTSRLLLNRDSSLALPEHVFIAGSRSTTQNSARLVYHVSDFVHLALGLNHLQLSVNHLRFLHLALNLEKLGLLNLALGFLNSGRLHLVVLEHSSLCFLLLAPSFMHFGCAHLSGILYFAHGVVGCLFV